MTPAQYVDENFDALTHVFLDVLQNNDDEELAVQAVLREVEKSCPGTNMEEILAACEDVFGADDEEDAS